MFSLNKVSLILFFVLLFTVTPKMNAQNIELFFSNIESSSGQIILTVYVDDKGFQDDKPIKKFKFKKHDIVKGTMTEKINLEPGVYGFALLDDQNNSGVMEYNFIKMPKEGFGFSNFYLSGLSKPHFEDFKFTVNKNQKVKVSMKIRYL
jgi:uncharacterized protein (DUF2141 family)